MEPLPVCSRWPAGSDTVFCYVMSMFLLAWSLEPEILFVTLLIFHEKGEIYLMWLLVQLCGAFYVSVVDCWFVVWVLCCTSPPPKSLLIIEVMK